MSSDKCSTREASQIVESNQLNSKFDKIEAVCSGGGFAQGSCGHIGHVYYLVRGETS